MNKLLYIFILSLLLPFNYNYKGDVLFGTVNRLSDGSIIKVPFRLFQISPSIYTDHVDLISNFTFQVNLKPDLTLTTYTMDMRELYINLYPSFGDIRLGKQIHSWGSLSNNNPTDNLNPINYYYIFSKGAERKEGVFSLAIDSYFGSNKVGFVLIPDHHENLIPLNDSELPININGLREGMSINQPGKPYEYGMTFQKNFSNLDLTISYFSGHDRTMSPYGANVWVNSYNKSIETAFIDTVLGFRDSDIYGIGISTFIGNLSLRSEFAYFITDDLMGASSDVYRTLESIGQDSYLSVGCDDIESDFNALGLPPDAWPGCEAELLDTLGVGTKADYYQYVLEFEYSFMYDIQLSGQLFFYDLLSISKGLTPIVEAQVDINLLPEDNFIPGVGAPLSLFTITETPYSTVSMKKARTLFLNLKKIFYDHGFELNLRTYYDIINKGKFFEIETAYDLTEKVKINTAINFISGNKGLSESYLFNPMEDFSHFRLECRYSF